MPLHSQPFSSVFAVIFNRSSMIYRWLWPVRMPPFGKMIWLNSAWGSLSNWIWSVTGDFLLFYHFLCRFWCFWGFGCSSALSFHDSYASTMIWSWYFQKNLHSDTENSIYSGELNEIWWIIPILPHSQDSGNAGKYHECADFHANHNNRHTINSCVVQNRSCKPQLFASKRFVERIVTEN